MCLHQFTYLCTHDSISALPPMHSYMETWDTLWHYVCAAVIPLLVSHLGYNVYMHQCMYLCPHDSQYHLKPLCIGTWKHGCPCMALFVSQSPHMCYHTLFRMCTCISTCSYVKLNSECCSTPLHSYMARWVPMSGIVIMFQFHTSGPTPCLECVDASIHVYMSTQLAMLAQLPMDS